MSVWLKVINNEKIKPIPLKNINNKDIAGYDLFSNLYANIFICAKKNSGKINVIWHIIKKCINLNTKVYIFCFTVFKDQVYLYIVDVLKKLDIKVIEMTNLDNLEDIIESLKTQEIKDNKQTENDEKTNIYEFFRKNIKSETSELKKKKAQKIAPENLFIFDDLSKQLQNRHISALFKMNKHFKLKILVSSQYPNNLAVDTRKQIDYYILFKGHSKDKLETIYKNANLRILFELFEKIYVLATKEPFSFLYIDTNKEIFRKNFNIVINY